MPRQCQLRFGCLAYDFVEKSARGELLVSSEKNLRAMVVPEVLLSDTGVRCNIHAATAEGEIPLRFDYKRSFQRSVGEDTQALAGAIL